MDSPTTKIDAMRSVTIVSISELEEDHAALEAIFREPEATLSPDFGVRIAGSRDWEGAFPGLRGAGIPIVVCDVDVRPGEWQQMARELRKFPDPPCLILASRDSDDRLCEEAAKQGAYEVLAKPFRGPEVLRVLKMAWRHWHNRYGLPAPAPEARQPSTGT